MLERPIKLKIAGQPAPLDASEVGVAESTERWSEVHLEDGSVLRIKPVVVSAARITGKYDPDGNPLYSLRVNQIMVVASAPDHLKKDAGGNPPEVH